MHPLLYEIGSLQFHSYPFFISLAFLVSTLLAAHHGDQLDPPVFVPPQGAVWTLIGALIGSRAWHIVQYDHWTNVWRAIFVWEVGLVFYGGLIGAILFSIVYLAVTKNLNWRIVDVCVPYLALGQAFGRTGCFLNGCCWGRISDKPWAVSFPKNSHAWAQHVDQEHILRNAGSSLSVHPTQLYSVFGLLVICLILRSQLKSSPFTFAIALRYMFLYGLLRFTVESFRGDSVRSVFEVMTVSQTVSLGLVVISAIVYAVLERRARRTSTSA